MELSSLEVSDEPEPASSSKKSSSRGDASPARAESESGASSQEWDKVTEPDVQTPAEP